MTMDELGEIKREFKPAFWNVGAGFIIGLLLIGGGCVGIGFAVKGVFENGGHLPLSTSGPLRGLCWVDVGIMTTAGLGGIVGGYFVIQWMRVMSSLRVRIGQNGFAVVDRKATHVYAWDDIVRVEEVHCYQRSAYTKALPKNITPAMMSKVFNIHVKEGEGFTFGANKIRSHIWLAQMVKRESDRRDVPWTIVEEWN